MSEPGIEQAVGQIVGPAVGPAGDVVDTQTWQFVRALVHLVENRGALAALRRGLGRRVGEAPEMYPYVVPHLPREVRPADEEAYFLIGALFAWHRGDWLDKGDTSFGASYRQLAKVVASESIERRFIALLNARRDDLPEHLRHAVGLLKSKEIRIDWTLLLRDVLRWDHPNRVVQRRWARAYWRTEHTGAAPDAALDGARDDMPDDEGHA